MSTVNLIKLIWMLKSVMRTSEQNCSKPSSDASGGCCVKRRLTDLISNLNLNTYGEVTLQ